MILLQMNRDSAWLTGFLIQLSRSVVKGPKGFLLFRFCFWGFLTWLLGRYWGFFCYGRPRIHGADGSPAQNSSSTFSWGLHLDIWRRMSVRHHDHPIQIYSNCVLIRSGRGSPNILSFHYSGYHPSWGIEFYCSNWERRDGFHLDCYLFSQIFLLVPFLASHQTHIEEDYHLLLGRGSGYDTFLGHADQLVSTPLSSSWARWSM